MSIFYSPLRYPGGKNCIFKFVSNFFYENNLVGMSYAEPYAGGSGLALRLLFEGYVDHIYINDLDNSIYAFWKTILSNPDEFCEWIENVDVSIKNWKEYRNVMNSSEGVSCFELAKATFFLNRTNISGVIKGGVIGGIEQKGRFKIDARFNKSDLIFRIKRIASLRDRIAVSNHDGLKFLKYVDKKDEDIFVYLDPPYFQKGADLYMNFYSIKDHEKLAKYIHKLKKKWMVSYDNNDFILNLYHDKRKVVHKLSQSASNRVGDEIFIFSDLIRFMDSISFLRFAKLI